MAGALNTGYIDSIIFFLPAMRLRWARTSRNKRSIIFSFLRKRRLRFLVQAAIRQPAQCTAPGSDHKRRGHSFGSSVLPEGARSFGISLPKQTPTRTFTYISPLDFDYPLFLSDSLVFIALDQYRSKQLLLCRSAELPDAGRIHGIHIARCGRSFGCRSPTLPSQGSDLLSAMLYEGKVLYLTHLLSPEREPHEVLRYTKEEWAFCAANEASMLGIPDRTRRSFSSDADWKRRLLLPAPFSKFRLPIDTQTPGRIGRWIGWQIIESACGKAISM